MNIKDIATLAETSVATVSRVINNDPRVSIETRDRVLEIIQNTGYIPNNTGRNLRTQKTNKILVLLPTIKNPYYAKVLEGVEHRAAYNDFDTIVSITHRDPEIERKYLKLLSSKQVDGVISFTSALPDKELDELAAKFPYVQCGSHAYGENISFTCIDNIKAAHEAISYLIRVGHKNIAFINGQFNRAYEIEREKGYRLALEENSIPIRTEYLTFCDYNYSEGYDCCKTLLSLKKPPTAIFTSYDQTAAGAAKYALESGLKLGQDLDIIGFDGTFIAEMFHPSLSSVSQPGYELGGISFELINEKIKDIHSLTKQVILPSKLILRESTRKLTT